MTQHEHKTFSGFEVKDEARGTVEAVVMTLNEVDYGADVVLPGAIKDGSTVKISFFGHSVITEGAPPVGAGKVHVVGNRAILKGQYFLNTQAGREAFETVRALGPGGCEWSTGFRVTRTAPLTQAWREKGAERLIAEMWLGECSPVFVAESRSTATLAVKSQDEQRELAAIVKAHEQRELRMIDMQLRLNPPRADHMVPPLVKERLADVTDFACKWLGLDYLEVRYYERRPGEDRVGFFCKSEPNVVWVAAGRRGDEMAITLAHEAVHAAGYDTEAAAEQGAETIVKAWEGHQTKRTPYGLPFNPYAQEPTVGSCGMFPPTGGW